MNAIMTDFDFKNGSEPVPQKWEGLAELDRALAERRATCRAIWPTMALTIAKQSSR